MLQISSRSCSYKRLQYEYGIAHVLRFRRWKLLAFCAYKLAAAFIGSLFMLPSLLTHSTCKRIELQMAIGDGDGVSKEVYHETKNGNLPTDRRPTDGDVVVVSGTINRVSDMGLKTSCVQSLAGADDADSVEIISCGAHFSPYKSHLHREISDELRRFEKADKRRKSLKQWNWDEVIQLSSSLEDEDADDDLEDTAASGPSLMKQTNICPLTMKLVDEKTSDDDGDDDDEADQAYNAHLSSSYERMFKIPRVTVHKRNRVVSIARSK